MEPEDLRIVTPTVEDLPIAEAARLAGVGTKTIRRAVDAGHLPRRYVMGRRGFQLVFWRADIERWQPRRVGRPDGAARQRHNGNRLYTLTAGERSTVRLAAALLDEIAADIEALQVKIDRAQALLPDPDPE